MKTPNQLMIMVFSNVLLTEKTSNNPKSNVSHFYYMQEFLLTY